MAKTLPLPSSLASLVSFAPERFSMSVFFLKRNEWGFRFQNCIPSEPPIDLPIIVSVLTSLQLQFDLFQEYQGRNLLSGPMSPSPGSMMKCLINQLFTKDEIINRQHESDNERTDKVKGNLRFHYEYLCVFVISLYIEAIRECFYNGDNDKLDGFWYFEGKVIRGNQRRGLIHRRKNTYVYFFSVL